MSRNHKIEPLSISHSTGTGQVLGPYQAGNEPSSKPGAWNHAFTLVEILVVIIILAISAAIIIPYAVGTSSSQARAAARMVMSDLEYAQNEAIVTQSPITVTFDISGNSYTVSNESGPLIHPITKKAYAVDFDTISGFENVSISSANFDGAATVTFDAIGAPNSGGTIVVSAGNHCYSITVAPVTGKITVSQCE